MSEEEVINYLKDITNNKIFRICFFSDDMAKTLLNIIEKQKEEEIKLRKELMKQDELIEKLSRELHNKTKRKIYIRSKKYKNKGVANNGIDKNENINEARK